MWRPQEVLPEFRRRAVVVWTLLIVGILSYFILLLYRGVEKRGNPNTSFVISDEIYTYPDVWVCLYDTYGCDDYDYEEQCVMSINDTEGGTTTARYRPGDEDETPISFTADITERGWCVIFEMSALDYNIGNQRDSDDYIDYTRVDMYWYPGGSANNSTTCIQEKGEWTAHKENVYAYLSDPVSGEVSAGIQIPYTCMTNESSSHYFTYMGIGVTKEHHITGDETASHNALMVSTVEHKDERNANITGIQAPYAYLSLQVQQESDSMIIITEIDPLDLAEILGQVGGFWDLILILWPLVFVAASYEAPHLKPRNFRESAAKVTETVAKVLPTKRQGLTSFPTERNTGNAEENEEMPHWERDVAPSGYQQEDEVLIRLFEDHGLVAVIDTSSRVARFLQSKFGARYLREGAEETALKNLLPPKTYLVMVSTSQTAISIATSVARHCKAGGDTGQSNSAGSFTLKVTRVSCSLLQSQALAASSYVRSNDCSVNESVVDLGEDFKNRKFTPDHPGRDAGRREARQEEFQRTSASCPWPKIPREIASPARRPLPTPGASLSNNGANVHSCVQSESKQTEIQKQT